MPLFATSPLLHLPNEVLDTIFQLLNTTPPSQCNFIEIPSQALASAEKHDLKNVAATCKQLRMIVLPHLFVHAKLDPYDLTDFLDFVYRNDLQNRIRSIVASVRTPYNHIHPAWYCRLLNELRVLRLTLCCPPQVFGSMTAVDICMTDAWAFKMPLHYLELEQSAEVSLQDISYDIIPDLLAAKPWKCIRVNEGSSLAAYTTWEYFLKKPPSLISNLHHSLRSLPTFETVHTISNRLTSPLLEAQAVIRNLTEFSFIAIFPFYNHVDDVLKTIRGMDNLRKLFVKLCPEPNRNVLEDEIHAAGRHFDINDPWNEVTTAYQLIAYTANHLRCKASLETLVIDDNRVTDLHESIVNTVEKVFMPLVEAWKFDGQCTWRKRVENT